MDAALTGGLRVALVPWGTPFEVFLDPLGKTLDDVCERLEGGWLFGYAEALRLAGHLPRIVVWSRSVSTRTERVHKATGTPVVVLPFPDRPAPPDRGGWRGDLGAYRRALAPGTLRALRDADVVLLQEYEEPRADLLAWWGLLRRVPVLASFQGGAPPWRPAPVQRLVRGPSMRRLSGLLVGPAQEAERVVGQRGVTPGRVHPVANPVDTQAWVPGPRAAARDRLGLPAEAFVVAWHGRVDVRRKGLDVLVEAWARLCAEAGPDHDLRLLLTGAGADDDVLRQLVADGRVRGVQWLAEYATGEQVRERLAACDLWVSPSRHEGFAVAPLEAMACGRPVVLSDAPGAAEALGEDGAGWLVPRGDPAALASALAQALHGRHGLEARGRAARRRVESAFSLSAVAGQLGAALHQG